jgi:hypothetical protein
MDYDGSPRHSIECQAKPRVLLVNTRNRPISRLGCSGEVVGQRAPEVSSDEANRCKAVGRRGTLTARAV